MGKKLVAVFLGSESDLGFIKRLHEVFTGVGVDYYLHIASADRNPEELKKYVLQCMHEEVEVFIAVASMAAILPSAIASAGLYFTPVIGVPKPSEMFGVDDALKSMFSKPDGCPILVVNSPFNAALAACQIIVWSNPPELAESFSAYMEGLRKKKQPHWDIDPAASIAAGKAVAKAQEGV
jgi:5-(carboxyamino)imidazole ribonucleotide mutase